MSAESKNYINIMLESLVKKKRILTKIVEKNTRQTEVIAKAEFDEIDWEDFNILVGEKESLIEQIDELDSGFELLFKRVEAEIKNNKEEYAASIKQMQELIVEITDLGNKIMAGEERNRASMEKILLMKKKEIKGSKMSVKAASSYYKNMSNMLDPDGLTIRR